MAKSTDNVVMHGVSGKLWDLLVFRQRKGSTFLGKIPKKSGVTTALQEQIRITFKKAVAYARSVVADINLKSLYESRVTGGQSAYNLAIADYFKSPKIGDIDLSGYTGSAGSAILAEASDDFEVMAVKVSINRPDGSLVEEGNATLQPDGLHWKYISTISNPSFAGDILTVTAADRPGNSIRKQKTM